MRERKRFRTEIVQIRSDFILFAASNMIITVYLKVMEVEMENMPVPAAAACGGNCGGKEKGGSVRGTEREEAVLKRTAAHREEGIEVSTERAYVGHVYHIHCYRILLLMLY